MKLKSVPATISTCLLALVIGILFSASSEAQSTGKKLNTTKTLAAVNKNNPPIKAASINEKALKTTVLEKSVTASKQTTSPKDADYWFAKGALCATYGNDRDAIKYFQKAISIDLNRSDAYFEQAISYGQLSDFDKAVSLVNKAIEMEPQNGLYLYGRGRIYLLNGKKDRAMEDIKKAAELDDEDAQAYLTYIAQQ
jgi:tetratricopeptide (TPR) repeat protein